MKRLKSRKFRLGKNALFKLLRGREMLITKAFYVLNHLKMTTEIILDRAHLIRATSSN